MATDNNDLQHYVIKHSHCQRTISFMQEKLSVMNLTQCKFLANSAKYNQYIIKNKILKKIFSRVYCLNEHFLVI